MKPIPNHDGYFANENGEIYSTRIHGKPRKLSLRKRVNGYPVVTLFKKWTERPKCRFVHQLILETFVGPRPPEMEAAHLNGVRHDCRADNLAWVTPKENRAHIILHGHKLQGEQIYGAKLTEATVANIRILRGVGLSVKYLAKMHNVSPWCIYDCTTRRWKHVATPPKKGRK
jgi:hypothetical protein